MNGENFHGKSDCGWSFLFKKFPGILKGHFKNPFKKVLFAWSPQTSEQVEKRRQSNHLNYFSVEWNRSLFGNI